MSGASGSFVTVEGGFVQQMAAGYAGGTNVLLDKYNQTFTLVNDLSGRVDNYLDTLVSTVDGLDLPAGWEDIVRGVDITEISALNLPSIPAPSRPSFPDFDSVTFPDKPSLTTPPAIDTGYTAPAKPAGVNPTLDYSVPNYSSDVWLDLYTKVMDGIVNRGRGHGSGIEDELWQRGKDRQQEENEKLQQDLLQDLANRNMGYSSLARLAIEMRVNTEILRQNTNLNSDITIKQADLAQAYYFKMIDAGLSLEQELRQFFKIRENLTLDAAKAAGQLLLDSYRTAMDGFKTEWLGIAEEFKIKKEAVMVILEQNKVLGSLYEISTQGSIAQTEAISKERQSIADVYDTDGNVHEANVRAQANLLNSQSEFNKVVVQRDQLVLEKAVQELKALVDSTVALDNLREKILSEHGALSGQVMAAALNAVHTSIGHSTSASESRSESVGFSGTVGETHYFDETETG